MLALIPKPPISRRQKRMALAVAGFVDFIQIAVFPLFFEGGISPFDDALDIAAAVALMAICGFKWQFVLAFVLELVPFVDILPTWTAVVLLLPAYDELIVEQVEAEHVELGEGGHDIIDVEAEVVEEQ